MPAALAAHARNLVGPLLRSTYRISTINADAIPPRGPVLILCDWNNIAAPSVIKAAAPRPVHVWADGPAAVPGPLLCARSGWKTWGMSWRAAKLRWFPCTLQPQKRNAPPIRRPANRRSC